MMQRNLIMLLAIWHVFNVGGQREVNTVAQFQKLKTLKIMKLSRSIESQLLVKLLDTTHLLSKQNFRYNYKEGDH